MSTKGDPQQPQGEYQLIRHENGIVYTAGITPRLEGRLIATGVVGVDLTPERMETVAEFTTERLLSILQEHHIDALRPMLLTVYITSWNGFTEHARYADVCSRVLQGTYGVLPARVAVGVSSLPGGSPIEISLIGTCGGRS